MPLYDYICDECNHSFDLFSSIANRHVPLDEECPSCKMVGKVRMKLNVAPIADPVRLGRIKAPGGFRDVLNQIHTRTPGSILNVDRNIG